MSIVKGAVKRLLAQSGYNVSRTDHSVYFQLEPLLYHLLEKNNDFFFIQIGANDGVSVDPLYPFVSRHRSRVRGIVIEPVAAVFERLCQNYREFDKIAKVNAAIHNSEKEMSLYKVDPGQLQDLPANASRIASFSRENLTRLNIPTDRIVTEVVRCLSFSDLLDEHNVTRVDMLQIDAEGYDAEIILSLDFGRLKPSVIRFEHGLGDGLMSEETFLGVVETLNRNGYQVIMERYDATAYQLLLDFREAPRG